MLIFLITISLFSSVLINNVDYYQNALDYQDEYVDEFASAQKNGKYGFVNKYNEFVVKPKYEATQNTPGEFFFVCKDKVGHKCAYMHKKTKKLLTGFKYLGCGNSDISEGFSEGMAKVVVVDKNGEWKTGYINTKGEEVIPPQYYYGTSFKNGVAEVQVNKDPLSKLMKIDKKGHSKI